jgi:protein SCO1/2
MCVRTLTALLAAGALLLAGAVPVLAHGDEDPATAAHGGAADPSELFDEKRALKISQDALGRTVGSHAFVDSAGNPVDLTDFRGKPLVVSLIYTSCYHTCPLITENLRNATRAALGTLGEGSFTVVTIGFDVKNDTPERLRVYAEEHGVDRPNWRLLSADAETIHRLAETLGFIYFPSPRGFDHLSQTTILDGDGAVYRQVYGASFAAPSIVEPLKDLIFGRVRDFTTISGIANRIRLFCTLYDPRDDRYYFDYSVFIGMIIGALSLGGVGVIVTRNVWRLWREGRAS